MVAANTKETMTTLCRCRSLSACGNHPFEIGEDEKIFHVCYLSMQLFNTDEPKNRFASDVSFAFDCAQCKWALGRFRIDLVNTLKLHSDRTVQKAKSKSLQKDTHVLYYSIYTKQKLISIWNKFSKGNSFRLLFLSIWITAKTRHRFLTFIGQTPVSFFKLIVFDS